MNRAVREAVQGRDEAVRSDEVVTLPWKPRTDGAQALLVSERQTVFDHKAAAVPTAIEPEHTLGNMGPMPADWTHDLVHCRLMHLAALILRLPGPRMPSGYRCWLGEQQPQEAGPRREPLTPEEEARMDWTWERVIALSEINRAIVMGRMAKHSHADIAKVLTALVRRRGGEALKKSGVHKRYRQICEAMANDWIDRGEYVDQPTRNVWDDLAAKKF